MVAGMILSFVLVFYDGVQVSDRQRATYGFDYG